MDRKIFVPPFYPNSLPPWICSLCMEGQLTRVKNSFTFIETAKSKKYYEQYRRDGSTDPTWITEIFSVQLICSACKEPVLLVGETSYDVEDNYGEGYNYVQKITPKYFSPPVVPFRINENCPEELKRELIAASELYWCSLSASGNRLRSSVEILLNKKRVRKTRISKQGKRVTLSLHERIEEFTKKEPELGEMLMAVKWLGNPASHLGLLKFGDVLDAFEILEHVIDEMFGGRRKRVKQMAKKIVKAKGVSR